MEYLLEIVSPEFYPDSDSDADPEVLSCFVAKLIDGTPERQTLSSRVAMNGGLL